MSEEITILDRYPIILTKDEDFIKKRKKPVKEGDLILLPNDAVLVIPHSVEKGKHLQID